VIALLASPALAQQGRGGRGGMMGMGGGGISMLLANASVQQELKLDAAQLDKAKELEASIREKRNSAVEGLQGQERMAKMREISGELNAQAEKSAKEFLKPEQLTRLNQINYQSQGAQAFTSEAVQSKLKLTDSQKSDIDSIIQDSNSEMRSLFQNAQGDPEGTRAKFAEHRKATLAKIEGKLDDAQKASWKELTGAPFEIKFEPRGGGRGGR
jgi:hypothetical protein